MAVSVYNSHKKGMFSCYPEVYVRKDLFNAWACGEGGEEPANF